MTNLSVLMGHTLTMVMGTSGGTGGYSPYVLPDLEYGDLWHVCDQSCASTTTLANAKIILDKAISSGIILAPLFHRVGQAGQWSEADFRSYIDYLYAKWKARLVDLITIDDLYKLTLGQVSVPG